MNSTKFCNKLNKNKTETNLQSALHCIELMSHGCSMKDAIKFSTKRNCKFDNTSEFYGPPQFRVLSLQRHSERRGWQQSEPEYKMKNNYRNSKDVKNVELQIKDLEKDVIQEPVYEPVIGEEASSQNHDINLSILKGEHLLKEIKRVKLKISEQPQQNKYIKCGKNKLFDLANRVIEMNTSKGYKDRLIQNTGLFDIYSNENIYEKSLLIQDRTQDKDESDNKYQKTQGDDNSIIQDYLNKIKTKKVMQKLLDTENINDRKIDHNQLNNLNSSHKEDKNQIDRTVMSRSILGVALSIKKDLMSIFNENKCIQHHVKEENKKSIHRLNRNKNINSFKKYLSKNTTLTQSIEDLNLNSQINQVKNFQKKYLRRIGLEQTSEDQNKTLLQLESSYSMGNLSFSRINCSKQMIVDQAQTERHKQFFHKQLNFNGFYEP